MDSFELLEKYPDYKDRIQKELEACWPKNISELEVLGLISKAKAKDSMSFYALMGLFFKDFLYHGYDIKYEFPVDDMYNEFFLSLTMAINSFDPAKYEDFKNHLKWSIISRLIAMQKNFSAKKELETQKNSE